MVQSELHLLLDFSPKRLPVDGESLHALLLTVPGVLSAQVTAYAGQALVDVEPELGVITNLLERLQAAGYRDVRASEVPDRAQESSYARYLYANPDSLESSWVD